MEQNKKHRRWQRPARRIALPLLLGGLVLLCVLGLAGCGGAFWTKGPKEPETLPAKSNAFSRRGKLPAVHPQGQAQGQDQALRTRRPLRRGRGYRKLTAVGFAPGEPYIDRALKLFYSQRGPFAWELGLFDIDEDGTPELMVLTYGTWLRSFDLYRLSGPVLVYLGWHWGPDGPVYTRQTDTGKIWRLDGNYSHNRELSLVSDLLILERPECTGLREGLEVWECGSAVTLFDPIDPVSAPARWQYRVIHSRFEGVRTVFSQRWEERLAFVSDELLEHRAAQDEAGRPPEEQLEENEYPAAEMEERLAASLYSELLSGDWTEVPAPWVLESDLPQPGQGWGSWVGFDLRTRLRRLYAAWLVRQGAAS